MGVFWGVLDQIKLYRAPRSLRAVGDLQLGEDMPYMAFRRIGGDHQLFGDRLIGRAGYEQRQHLALPRRKRLQQRRIRHRPIGNGQPIMLHRCASTG